MGANNRTRLSFRYEGDIWPMVEKWASENGFKIKEDSGSERLYQKGTGSLVAPMMLKLRTDAREISLEAWIRVNNLVRLVSLYLVPSEMGIESGGFKLVVPRSLARNAINQLLARLGQSLIP